MIHQKGKAMNDELILDTTTPDGVRIVVRNRRVTAGIAGQRAVSVNVDYYGPGWEDHTTPCFVHNVYGGPVAVRIGAVLEAFVHDAGQYGDTTKLDETWFRNYFGGGSR